MNYFIFIDDKFANSLIEEIGSICAESKFFIRGDEKNKKFINIPNVEWLDYPIDKSLNQHLRQIGPNDKIYIDWYDLEIGSIVIQVAKEVEISVFLMGGDFFVEPMIWHYNKILDNQSKKYYKRTELFPVKWARRPGKLTKQFYELLQKLLEGRAKFRKKILTVQRINNILINRYDGAEVELIKKIYSANSIKHLSFSFDQNFDVARTMKRALGEKPAEKSFYFIQIGNSATITNNHLDVLDNLKKFKDENVKLFFPMAYGDERYRMFVLNAAEGLFPENIIAQTNLIGRQEYVSYLQQIDICVMGHLRSQALGNCVTLLALGKKIFLKKSNPLFSMFNAMGVTVFCTDTISQLSFSEFVKPLSMTEIEENIQKLESVFSRDARMKELGILLKK